jgi:hypothetical protein
MNSFYSIVYLCLIVVTTCTASMAREVRMNSAAGSNRLADSSCGVAKATDCNIWTLGDFDAFDWNAAKPYAAYGIGRDQIALDKPGNPLPCYPSTLVVDPLNEVLFLSFGDLGGKQWYFRNGSYLALPTVDTQDSSGFICYYWPTFTYAAHAKAFSNSVALAGEMHSPEESSHSRQKWYNGHAMNPLIGKDVQVSLIVDRFDRVHGLSIVTPMKNPVPDGNAARTSSSMQDVRTIVVYKEFMSGDVLSYVEPLHESCLDVPKRPMF